MEEVISVLGLGGVRHTAVGDPSKGICLCACVRVYLGGMGGGLLYCIRAIVLALLGFAREIEIGNGSVRKDLF